MSSTSDRLMPMSCLRLSLEFRSPARQQQSVTHQARQHDDAGQEAGMADASTCS